MKHIELFWTPQGWLADFVGDVEVRRAFGTTLIPTAYTKRATADVVLSGIRQLNPDCNVVIQTPPHQILALGLN